MKITDEMLQYNLDRLTDTEATAILQFWDHEAYRGYLGEAYMAVAHDAEPDIEYGGDMTVQTAQKVIEQYERAHAHLQREENAQREVMTKIRIACELVNVPTPSFTYTQAQIVLIRIQTKVNEVWNETYGEGPPSQADQILSEVADIIHESAEEFCDA